MIAVAIHNERGAQSVQVAAIFGIIDVVLEEHLRQINENHRATQSLTNTSKNECHTVTAAGHSPRAF